ncbi:glycoside hydrolase family 28 protein [Aureibaculum algae]|uniref:Glycoside hydrolase family 28 protein n=1 Tax=Aureibaculum algae TaxID=2584122 RepID=A0A5B7TMV8_9FLAO|nr:glycosyl hydrolase family 28 protein [Aureibaculum algae]QCX37875.1 glycoside hydrolase family 28 protein [Aureibaculum algae]
MKHLFISMVLLLLLVGCKEPINNSKKASVHIPQKSEVGVLVMPKEIAPVTAPFPTIAFKRPDFPTDTIVVDLKTDGINTKIIQHAIDTQSAKGGGIVVISKGQWFTGRIALKDNINLHFLEGATLSFSGEIEDYLPVVFTRTEGVEVMSLGACIYANGVDNIAITGKGRLIGPAEGSIREKIVVSVNIDEVIDPKTPVKDRIIDGTTTPYVFPPMFISAINSTKVFIEDVSLENTAFWNIVPIYCDNVIIRGVSINSVNMPRGDGIDIESSKNVLIEYCNLSTGDDCFTMKAGRGIDGMRVNKSTENIVVRYCLAENGHGGITCGSETAGIIKNLYVHDCVFINSGVGIRFKTRRPRGGGGENLTYERIRMDLKNDALKWDMLGSTNWVGKLAERLPARAVNELTPHYKNIKIKDLIIENAKNFIKVRSIPESPLENVVIENIEVNCKNFMNIHDMNNAVFKNINITSEDSLLTFLDSKNIRLLNVNSTNATHLDIQGSMSDSIFVESSLNIKDTIFRKNEGK